MISSKKNPTLQKSPLRQESHSEILERVRRALKIDARTPDTFAASLPFSPEDCTCGCENELQAVVVGSSDAVDLPISIQESTCYRNLLKRHKRDGEHQKKIEGFEAYLYPASSTSSKYRTKRKRERPRSRIQAPSVSTASDLAKDEIWENSWVRFPRTQLNLYANQILERDLHRDKPNPSAGYRKDLSRFFVDVNGMEYLRVPISYLLKLSLADAVGNPAIHTHLRSTAKKMMACYLSDNSSPEIISFFPSPVSTKIGREMKPVRETALRFLLTQLLTGYANTRFKLLENGQRALAYFASHTHQRQKAFNNVIPDAFYRDLFMSPCLSGWDHGEEKHAYMHRCHRVLSRSRLNAVNKLKDAGIITSNLVVLPNISDVSLANNGTHVSFGSNKITTLLKENAPDFTPADEKYLGDLVIKICEHFLPLFVGTYSATPYRLDFEDFHPEKILGFLPHELDFTHLRMIWKQWKKKSGLKILSRPITPFGPELLDRSIRRIFSLKGDIVPDFRLIDYFAAVMSTDENSLLDGKEGNEARLSQDLQEMGIFDTRLSLYMLLRLRKVSIHGFSGMEARYFSTFESLFDDLGEAIQLQRIILTLAWKMILEERVTHDDIPDIPEMESERRQIFFGSAIGIKTVFIHENSPNRFLSTLLTTVQQRKKLNKSIKYPGYIKLHIQDYLVGLVDFLESEMAESLHAPDLSRMIRNLRRRIQSPKENRVADRMVTRIMKKTNVESPLSIRADRFNRTCESYLREDLRKKHMIEGLKVLTEALERLDLWATYRDPECHSVLKTILDDTGMSASAYLSSSKSSLLSETADEKTLEKMIQLIVLTVEQDIPN